MSTNVEELVNFFKERHIVFKPLWLQAILGYFQISNKPSNILYEFVYYQWLHQDLKVTSDSIKRIQKNQPKVVSIADIAANVFDHNRIPGQLINSLLDELAKTPRRRIFVMELSDGNNTVTAIEHEALDKLTNQRPGCKVAVYGKVALNNKILLLNPQNCQVLGGQVVDMRLR